MSLDNPAADQTLRVDGNQPLLNGSRGYGLVSRVIHWLTALLMFLIVGMGLLSTAGVLTAGQRDIDLLVHKSFGMTVIALTLIRLAWISYSPAALDRAQLAPWEVIAARMGHGLLYAILLLMPVSGLIMSIGAGRPTSFFYLITIPQFLPFDPALGPHDQYYYKLGRFLHDDVFQWALYAIFTLHMVGVVKHQFIDGQRDFIRRMWGRGPV